MLINFCQNYLGTQVKCDKPHTESHDVKNLLTNIDSGFLAYSTIKPPINIDFHFICNIKLSHVLIWSCVGSQKSTGFKISTKFHHQQYSNPLSCGFLHANHIGISFSTKYLNENIISLPKTFYNASINHHHNKIIDRINNLRITIIKTDKSVPAINKIEIWGYISSFNKLENSTKIFNLLSKQDNLINQIQKSINNINDDKIIDHQQIESDDLSTLMIPEEYLDPITCAIMLKPIILPSGNIIDHSTLENYGDNEALWGRPLSDPFTGILLSNNYKPIFSVQLKLKIDKYLSENADNIEIKQLPRILGIGNNTNLPSCSVQDQKKIVNICTDREMINKKQSDMSMKKLNCLEKKTKHKLPIVVGQQIRTVNSNIISKISKNSMTPSKQKILQLENDEILKINCKIDDKFEKNLQIILSNLKRFSDIKKFQDKDSSIIKENICYCCESPIYYKLPCNHIVCRKVILSYSNSNNNNNNNINSQCPQCNLNYKSSDIVKFNV